jgi:hypothetical protein
MASTPSFNWSTPDNTGLVKNGALDIRTLGNAIDTSMTDLLGGTTGQVLKKNSNTDMDFVWSSDASGMTNPMTTTGDTIYSSSGSTPARLGIGSTGQVLTVSGGVPTWATPSAGSSFVGCAVYKATTNQTLANDVNADITFNAEEYDTNGFHDNSTNNERITIPSGKAGKYLLQTMVIFPANSTGVRDVAFQKNGTDTLGSTLVIGVATFTNRVAHLFVGDFAVGDYITVNVNQSSGGNLNVLANQNFTRFTATYLGA